MPTAAAVTSGSPLVQLMMTLGMGGIFGTVVNAVLNRRSASAEVSKVTADTNKVTADTEAVRAETMQVLTGNAMSQLASMREDLDRARAENELLREEITRLSAAADRQAAATRRVSDALDRQERTIRDLQDRERGYQRQFAEHSAWEMRAFQMLGAHGIHIDPPPDPPEFPGVVPAAGHPIPSVAEEGTAHE